MPIQITVEATDVEGRPANPTALELAAALTFDQGQHPLPTLPAIGSRQHEPGEWQRPVQRAQGRQHGRGMVLPSRNGLRLTTKEPRDRIPVNFVSQAHR